MFDAGKTRMIGLPYDDMLSRFHLLPERYGQTDRRTDLLTRDKNLKPKMCAKHLKT